MIDPLAQAVTLLAPRASYSKTVSGAGTWRVRRTHGGEPGYFVILDGTCRLVIDDEERILEAGDFVLIPAGHGFAMSSLVPPSPGAPDDVPVSVAPGEFRLGTQDGPVEATYLVGHFVFDAPDAALLVSLLPRVVLVRGQQRLSTLVQLVSDESRAARPARDVVLSRLLEVLLIEALRSTADEAAAPGLLRGIADERLCAARAAMDRGAAGEGSSAVALGVLCAVPACRGHGANGVPADVEDGAGQAAVAGKSGWDCRGGRARRLWFSQCFQRGVYAACGVAADAVCEGAVAIIKRPNFLPGFLG